MSSDEIIPPPPTTPSVPIDVQEARIWRGGLVDVAGIAALTTLLICKACPADYEVHALFGIFVIAGGSQLLKALGRNPGVLVMGFAGAKALAAFLSAHAARSAFVVLLATSMWLAACTSMPPVQDARIALNKTGEALNRLRPVLVAACAPSPVPAWCPEAIANYNDVEAGYKLAQQVLDAVPVPQ